MVRFPIIGGVELINQKMKIESNKALCLDGRHRMGGHNNQIVGISSPRDIGEETQPGRDMWGGVVSSFRVVH